MEKRQQDFEEERFIEDVGLYVERYGLSRMAGRVLGWLLICDPAQQSMEDLSRTLGASKGSISTVTRILIQIGLIERVGELVKQSVASIAGIHELSERGLRLIEGHNRKPATQLLENIRDMSAYLEKELPAALQRWQEERCKAG
ncbi:MAG: MarR family transcriptional regulator [Chloroflexi bacterium]|nr:MarR family transcriptional regulator [Chloroflexota bacterium]